MFSRGAQAAERGGSGLGIGLALARRLIELHGGTLEGRSEGPGRGSEFVVRLPLALSTSGHAAECEKPGFDIVASSLPLRILVVDDNRDAARTLAMVLESLGGTVELAYSGSEALAKFEAARHGIVFLDIGMPDMDGYEVARRIRADFPEARVMLIALTGWGQDTDRRRARDAGFDRHIVKPASVDALRELLGSADEPSGLSVRGSIVRR